LFCVHVYLVLYAHVWLHMCDTSMYKYIGQQKEVSLKKNYNKVFKNCSSLISCIESHVQMPTISWHILGFVLRTCISCLVRTCLATHVRYKHVQIYRAAERIDKLHMAHGWHVHMPRMQHIHLQYTLHINYCCM
jgi:hypothetical protein